jgi:hypothetical protein
MRRANTDNPAMRFTFTHPGREHPILALQKTAGNQSVLRWLRTPPLVVPPEPDPSQPRERVWPKIIPALIATMLAAYGLYSYILR